VIQSQDRKIYTSLKHSIKQTKFANKISGIKKEILSSGRLHDAFLCFTGVGNA
jgi:hypothetical protein